jgi:predicted peroxiredoxin
MKDANSILYVQTTGQPEKQYSPLVLKQTAKIIPGVKIVGAGTFNDLALDAGVTMWL